MILDAVFKHDVAQFPDDSPSNLGNAYLAASRGVQHVP
jgi:hypothetical protein